MPDEFKYDVFLSHSAKDKAVVRRLPELIEPSPTHWNFARVCASCLAKDPLFAIQSLPATQATYSWRTSKSIPGRCRWVSLCRKRAVSASRRAGSIAS